MLPLVIAVLFSVILTGTAQSLNERVDHYAKVIASGQAQAENFELPVDARKYEGDESQAQEYGQFDYIIVGAGAAGTVLARRLSEASDSRILLLEAGDYGNDFVHIPGMQPYSFFTEYNWAYLSTPQENSCQGMVNKQCVYPRGKGVGGSTLINGLVYSRGNRLDYDKWAEITGDERWSYRKVLPYFKKAENFSLWYSLYHGRRGPHHVEYNHPFNTYQKVFIEANEDKGRSQTDYNGIQQLGVARTQFNTLYGRRDDTARAFLSPVSGRQNLEIKTKSFVTKVLIESKTATGVYFMNNGKKYLARAGREVILSAGALISPQLLMLSGIGPKKHLDELGIPVVANLPVGQHLNEHIGLYDFNFAMDYTPEPKTVEQNIEDFLHGRGEYVMDHTNVALAYLRADGKRRGRPDYEICMATLNGTDYLTTQRKSHFTNETYHGVYSKLEDKQFFQVNIFLLHPKSRGEIRLKSTSPFDYPLIDPKLLTDDEGYDIEMVYKGIQIVLELLETDAFKKWNVTLVPPELPACASFEALSKEFWYCAIRQLAMDANHTVGTSRMGKSSEDSVVDSELRVHGVKKLRVVDASIFPSEISGHISAPTEMVAEVASALILNTESN